MEELPYCKYLYALDANARQITANVARSGLMPEQFGRDRRERPYLAEALGRRRTSHYPRPISAAMRADRR
jgi:hypothetical protein